MSKPKPLQPCNNCPYRRDAPLQLWHREEFVKLLFNDKNPIESPIYGCHKKNGHDCVGWLLNQRERGVPSIELRLKLLKGGEDDYRYLNSLFCDVPTFSTIEEMIVANFPDLQESFLGLFE